MARYTVETATGAKRKAVYAKTRKEAAEKLTVAMADASKGITADGGPKTVGAFLTSWLETSVRGSVRKSTYDRNESLCRVHLRPALGRKKLKTLSAADVAGFYRSRLDSGCSAASVRKMHETLHKALRQAVRWGYMMKNPADDVDPPKVPTQEVTPLTREEARGLLSTVQGDRLEALIRSSLAYGPAPRRTTRAPLGGPRPRSPQATGTQDGHERRRQALHRSNKNREGSKDGKAHAGRHGCP